MTEIKERLNKGAHGACDLWYPEAIIPETKMPTRGKYKNGYPQGAIVHFTAGRHGTGAIPYGAKQGYCYFLIDKDGKVYQSFPLDEWGWHAGKSKHPKLYGTVSDELVGIEITGAGRVEEVVTTMAGTQIKMYKPWYENLSKNYLTESQVRHSIAKDNIKEGFYEKFSEEQEDALINLLIWLYNNNPKVFSYDLVLGHDEVSLSGKNDPGASLSMTMPELRNHLKTFYSAKTV